MDYSGDIVLLDENPVEMQRFFNILVYSVLSLEIHVAPKKCKIILQECVDTTPTLPPDRAPLESVNRLVYLGSCITPDDKHVDE